MAAFKTLFLLLFKSNSYTKTKTAYCQKRKFCIWFCTERINKLIYHIYAFTRVGCYNIMATVTSSGGGAELRTWNGALSVTVWLGFLSLTNESTVIHRIQRRWLDNSLLLCACLLQWLSAEAPKELGVRWVEIYFPKLRCVFLNLLIFKIIDYCLFKKKLFKKSKVPWRCWRRSLWASRYG